MSSNQNPTEVVYETYDDFAKSEQEWFRMNGGGTLYTQADLLTWQLGLFGEKHKDIVGVYFCCYLLLYAYASEQALIFSHSFPDFSTERCREKRECSTSR